MDIPLRFNFKAFSVRGGRFFLIRLFFYADDGIHGMELWTVDNEALVFSVPPVCEAGVDPQTIRAGEGTALWWWSQHVSSATINNEKWSVTVPSDYTWFYPTDTATYTMTAVGDDDGATATCNTTITVE